MTPAGLDAAARELFGERYQRPLAEALGVSPSAVSHWLRDEAPVPVPGPVSAAVAAWCEVLASTGLRPPVRPGSAERFDPSARPAVRGRKPLYARLLQEGDETERAPPPTGTAPFPCPGGDGA